MTDADKIRLVGRPRWGDVPGNSFPPGSLLWGCGAYVLRRGDGGLFRAPPGSLVWGRPEGSWSSFHLEAETARRTVVEGFLKIEPVRRLRVEEVWDAHPDLGSRTGGQRSAHKHRVRLSEDRWVSGNLLRCFLNMVFWDELWSTSTSTVLLLRRPTLLEGRAVVGAVGRIIAPKEDPPPVEWDRLWPSSSETMSDLAST